MADNPKKAQTILTIILVIILIVIIVIGLYYFSFSGNTTKNPNNDNSSAIVCNNTLTKTYVSSNSSCLINFLCIQGTISFKDNCGCGCEKINQTINQTTHKIYNVKIEGYAFVPQNLTININDTVIWKNLDFDLHTITSDSGKEINSNAIKTTGTYSHTFFKKGTFNYHCNIHTNMSGTIIVQ
jgi:plastocyanin